MFKTAASLTQPEHSSHTETTESEFKNCFFENRCCSQAQKTIKLLEPSLKICTGPNALGTKANINSEDFVYIYMSKLSNGRIARGQTNASDKQKYASVKEDLGLRTTLGISISQHLTLTCTAVDFPRLVSSVPLFFQ